MTGIFATFAVSLCAMIVVWLISIRCRDASIVDIWWAPGFVALSAVATVFATQVAAVSLLLLAMVTVWAARLGAHLTLRHRRMGEDARYRAMRETNMRNFASWSLRWIFLLQGAIMWMVALPLVIALTSTAHKAPGALTVTGVTVFAAGFIMEAVADRHLTRFRADPGNRDKVLDSGLWAWSRHPNYFGESLVWWGIYIAAVSADPGAWWTAVGPALLTVLLLKVSGVPMLETSARIAGTDAYRDYIARTSPFIPLPPARQEIRASGLQLGPGQS